MSEEQRRGHPLFGKQLSPGYLSDHARALPSNGGKSRTRPLTHLCAGRKLSPSNRIGRAWASPRGTIWFGPSLCLSSMLDQLRRTGPRVFCGQSPKREKDPVPKAPGRDQTFKSRSLAKSFSRVGWVGFWLQVVFGSTCSGSSGVSLLSPAVVTASASRDRHP
jgi:hypothetical protein